VSGKEFANLADLGKKDVAAGFSLRQYRLEAYATEDNP
jgi:hypothetical protein